MKLSALSLLTVACVATASSHGAETMEYLMSLKQQSRERARSQGLFDINRYPDEGAKKCKNGKAGEYSCENVDLLSFLSHQALGSVTREGNDVWGWTSAEGREFGIVGQTDGVAFVEILEDGSLEYVGRLGSQTEPSTWRDIKVIGDHAYIGSEAAGHGLQIFDLNKLTTASSSKPTVFSTKKDLTAWYRGFGSSHNIVAHEETNMIYAVGTARNLSCAGGLWMVDVSDPANPTSPGCVNEDGYVHDAQCVIYKGPDEKYIGQEICFNFNEDTLTIADVTDKKNPIQISKTPYVGASYTHQGWLVDENDHSYLLLDDELDEMDGTGSAANGHTTTYIFDIKDLSAPKHTGTYQSPVRSIDHNQYVVAGLSYQSNYGSGLRVVDVSSVFEDPTASSFKEVGSFDVHPEDDAVGGEVEFVGSWSVYPFFASGHILLNSIERGIYSLKYTGPAAEN
ncbi:hypothetical protein AN7181.2 [Aspergillus nidulans FGSC A4]|uniref:Regulatory P domain-containing protein n=1 Tax=Emericella nidulans (strain FGSC A4 / ATCC 38163 / CBS 112.46 / NRRL 194 / M139) TaxID=227321 RepID=Q5AWZ9_EMENI|nr:hypothetical protein [Aspergillus nidulans FGSC A4]EAA61433.1 hypothetical protein AN7181.2 [Aspergillus nidulans FGSC A4]CBF78913.1 TPA: conserved hypothetical protein [Aspergillus nidulans FGSC A4]|eukprot:XP_664785.1 hypothetical protein AN7181.2 [Aspergillus nidulans FGSC A4]